MKNVKDLIKRLNELQKEILYCEEWQLDSIEEELRDISNQLMEIQNS